MSGAVCDCGWLRPTVGVFDATTGEIRDPESGDYVLVVLCPRCSQPAFQGQATNDAARRLIDAETAEQSRAEGHN
jgi:hypothetical protein